MVFYLIGLGLDKNSISKGALNALQECENIYLENYTVDYPYKKKDLENELKVKIDELNREEVEDESILAKSKDKNVALLVYGDSLSATTHMQLILSCKKQKIPYKIFHCSSILTAVAVTGLQLYKFGKVTSMPNWKEHLNKPKSFVEYIKENKSINAHSLILIDIGLGFNEALNQLEESGIREEKLIVLSNAGNKNQKIFYDSPKNLIKKDIFIPYCIIIPAKLNFFEEESIKELIN